MMPSSEPWLSAILRDTLSHSFFSFPPIIDFEYNTWRDADPRTKVQCNGDRMKKPEKPINIYKPL